MSLFNLCGKLKARYLPKKIDFVACDYKANGIKSQYEGTLGKWQA
jgi:hypothetical protein